MSIKTLGYIKAAIRIVAFAGLAVGLFSGATTATLLLAAELINLKCLLA
jgi:hypothetical protein